MYELRTAEDATAWKEGQIEKMIVNFTKALGHETSLTTGGVIEEVDAVKIMADTRSMLVKLEIYKAACSAIHGENPTLVNQKICFEAVRNRIEGKTMACALLSALAV